MFQSDLFKNKVALVTGGGSGIGFAIAQQLLQLGATVIISSRKEERLRAATEKLSAFGSVRYAVLDIREAEQIEQLAQSIKSVEGKLDILVNNAGGQFPSPAADISFKGWNAVINNNLNGTFYVTQTMAKHFFIPNKSGTIVNIIANMFRGFPGMAHTGAARAGVENLTKTLAVEWSIYNININAVAPGIIII
jgi:citronellol/citronellal dehydrogenase